VRNDRLGIDGRYVAAVSNPAYLDAFTRRLIRGERAIHEYTDEEREAIRTVAHAEEVRAALGVSSGPTGGYAIPAALDPTILLTNDGELNPIREIATVRQITSNEWRGVTSDGVTAAYAAEATEVTDVSPTLAQPTIIPERAHAFVKASVEVVGDWANLQQELTELFTDAKSRLEAEKFVHGLGHASNEPLGLLVGATAVVLTAATATLAAGDFYSTQEALPPRWQPRASWLTTLSIANKAYRSGGISTEPALFNDARDRLVGKPWAESTAHVTTTTTGSTVASYGDFSQYVIVDRVGASLEVIPHMLGSNRLPTLERGFVFWWRGSAEPVIPGAFRHLKLR
jgi:HK97 family phage major capsid protein